MGRRRHQNSNKNYEFFLKKNRIPFVNNYCDAQKYCQSFITSASSSQQIGLSAAAFELGVNPDEFPHHRALDDSLLTAACLKRVNDSERLKRFITPCNRVFYEKLAYKPHIIRDIDNPIVDRSVFNCVCDVCGGKVKKRRTGVLSINLSERIFIVLIAIATLSCA